MAKHYLPRVLVTALVGSLLLLFLATRRSPSPEHGRDTTASAFASARPALSPAPSSPQAEAAPASAPADRLGMVRHCLHTAETDPLAAMELALKNNLTADDPGLLTSLIMQWASRDFDAAYTWTKTQEAGAWRDNTLAHVAYLRSQTDPLAAARIVVTDISAGRARDEAIISILHQWALRAPDEARSWMKTFDQGPLRQRAESELNGIQQPGA